VPGKLISVFIITALLTEAAKKRGWLRVFLIWKSAQGRRFGSAGALGCAAPVLGKLVKENQGECPGAKPDPKLQQCGKLTSVFINTTQGRSSKKKRLVKVVFIGATAQGRRFGSAGLLDGLHQCPGRKISFTSCKRSNCPGAAGAGAGKLQPFPG